jgi:uncharacterized iron-regulated membrane protein
MASPAKLRLTHVVRRVLFWCHLSAGIAAGSIILVLSATGVLLTYQRQIEAWTDIRTYGSEPGPGDRRLPADTLIAAVRTANPELRVVTLTVYADRRAPAWIAAGPRSFYLNPYTAQILGEGPTRTRAFFAETIEWHRWLSAAGERRQTAKTITGACNLAFLFLVTTGFCLWLPRGWTRPQLRAVTWFKRGLRGKARDFNWHNTIGLWTAVPLFVIVAGGVVISYTWASDLVFRAAGEAPPILPAAAPAAAVAEDPRRAAGVPLETMLGRAERQRDDWRTITMRVPSASSDVVGFTIDSGTGGQPQKRGTLTLSTATADVVKWEPFQALTMGRRWRSYMRWVHSGEVAGIAGQTVAGLASLGAGVLVCTGVSLALRRLSAYRRRRELSPP